jgi:hypothetical protein
MIRARYDVLTAIARRRQFGWELDRDGLDASELPVLEHAGLIHGEPRGLGRWYRITSAGTEVLRHERERREDWAAFWRFVTLRWVRRWLRGGR